MDQIEETGDSLPSMEDLAGLTRPDQGNNNERVSNRTGKTLEQSKNTIPSMAEIEAQNNR